MNSNYYQPSGKFSPLGLATALGLSLIGVLIGSWVYGYAAAWIPIIYLNVLLVFAYGFGAGFLVSTGIRIGKIRNVMVALGLGLVAGLVAIYGGWVTWIYAMSSQELFIWHPQDLWTGIVLLGQEGVWTIKGSKPTGWLLYSFWIAEALIVLGFSLTTSYNAVADSPYCEDCQQWVDQTDVVGVFEPLADPQKFKRGLEEGRLESEQLLGKTSGEPRFAVLQLESCSHCEKCRLLTVMDRTLSYDKEGREQVSDEKWVQRLLISSKLADEVRHRYQEIVAQQQVEPPTEEGEVEVEKAD